MQSWIVLLTVAAAATVLTAAAYGQVAYCPRVTSEHNADTSDLMRFRNFHAWKDKTGNDLAIAVWQYLAGHETGIYHFENLYEGPDPFSEYSQNLEPLKLLNVYNQGYCATMNPMLAGIFVGIGFPEARSVSITNPSHTVAEAYYDDAWHYFDADLRGCLIKPGGAVASLEECMKDLSLWTDPAKVVEPHFPHSSGVERMRDLGRQYASAQADPGYRWWTGSHTMDFYLRPGESFTRYWQVQDGRWNHRPEYNKIDWLRKNILKPPVGMKSNHADFSRWTQGNGLWHYAPNLKAPSSDFPAGAWSSEGLEPGKDGLVLTAEKARADLPVFTPYVIVPKVNDLDNFDDDTEASVLSLDVAVPVEISVSTDNGLSWKQAGTVQPGPAKLDLTRFVSGRYGYLLRLQAGGRKGDLAVRSLAIDTWVQVAPISLPRLMKGTNRLRYEAGDRYGQPTLPMLVLPNTAEPDDLARHVVQMPTNYDPKRNLSRIQGEVVVKLTAPPGAKISWLSAGATFFALQGQQAPRTDNRIAYAVGEPKEFKEVYKSQVPEWTGHWRCNYDTDIRLDSPAETVYVRFIGRPGAGGVNVIRAALHLTPPRQHDPAVRITHGYKTGGKMVEKTVEMKAPGDYTIDCDGEVENAFIRMEKASK